jgi:hypothetical protein
VRYLESRSKGSQLSILALRTFLVKGAPATSASVRGVIDAAIAPAAYAVTVNHDDYFLLCSCKCQAVFNRKVLGIAVRSQDLRLRGEALWTHANSKTLVLIF